MEAMGIIGFIFGLAGLSYALTAKKEIAEVKAELKSFKASFKISDKTEKDSSSE